MSHTSQFIPFEAQHFSEQEMLERSQVYYKYLNQRRSLREFSDRPVPKSVIENILMTASSAPSGAHKQPWTFCAISSPELKKQIRQAAEKEEFENYHGRMSEDWLKDLEVFETNESKPFLEIAPWLIVVCRRIYDQEEGKKRNNYYVNESVGLASGFLLTAIHHAGLVALTHTPSPMSFLMKILDRPKNEKPFLLIPVGYPIENPKVPALQRKSSKEVIAYYE